MAVKNNNKKSAGLVILMLLSIPLLAGCSNATRAGSQEDLSLGTFCSHKCFSCLVGAAASCVSIVNILWNKPKYCACFVDKVIAEPCFFKK